MRRTLLVLMMTLSAAAHGQTTFKCQDGERVVYSDKPCATGVEVKRMAPDGSLTAEDRARAKMKQRAEQARAEAAAREAARPGAPAVRTRESQGINSEGAPRAAKKV